MIIEKHLPVTNAITAVELLHEHTEFSKTQIKDIMQKGAVWLTDKNGVNRLRRAKRQLEAGDEIHFYYNKSIIEAPTTDPTLISDEKQYSVWNKPKGMLSQGSKWGDNNTLYRWAEQHLQPQRPAFIVHRLDRAASGLMLLAHSKKMAQAFSALFQKGLIEKHYRAAVQGQFQHQAPFEISTEIDGKPAHSIVSLISYDADKSESIVDVEIKTGRKHQIRIHLASIDLPIIGDRLYNEATANADIDLQLTAWKLSFVCPVTKYPRTFELPTA